MRQIPQRILNKTVVVTKMVQVKNNSGDVGNTRVVVKSGVKIRITDNVTPKSEYGGMESGKFVTSTHIGFCNYDETIEIGYYIEDGLKKYSVDGVDNEPGGVLNHHIEIGMSLNEPAQI